MSVSQGILKCLFSIHVDSAILQEFIIKKISLVYMYNVLNVYCGTACTNNKLEAIQIFTLIQEKLKHGVIGNVKNKR